MLSEWIKVGNRVIHCNLVTDIFRSYDGKEVIISFPYSVSKESNVSNLIFKGAEAEAVWKYFAGNSNTLYIAPKSGS